MTSTQRAPTIHPTAQIADSAVIEAPLRPLLSAGAARVARETVIGPDCWIGEQCIVGAGTVLGAGSIVENGVHIEGNAEIGDRVLFTHRAQVGAEAVIGADSVIGGFVADGSKVGRGCRVFGNLVHRQLDPHLAWDDPDAQEPSPVVADGAFVGWGATVIGPVTIESGAYVAAGAMLTRSVPAGHIASGINRVVPASEWDGPLKGSPFFR